MLEQIKTIKNIINDENVDYVIKNGNLFFQLFDQTIETDIETFFIIHDNEKIKVDISSVDELYNLVATKVMRHSGIFRHPYAKINHHDLNSSLTHLLEKMSNASKFKKSYILERINYVIASPRDLANSLHISENFIRNIRKVIRTKIIDECKKIK